MTTDQSPFTVLANFNKAASDPLRLEIVRLLSKHSFGVLELATITGQKQSSISHHLKMLADQGLVNTRREGNSIFYSRALPVQPSLYAQLHDRLLETIDDVPIRRELANQVHRILTAREQASKQFFDKLAEPLKEKQDLIAAHDTYARAACELIDQYAFTNTGSALEVGPGEGYFLPELAKRFTHVTALDNSSTMLALAQSHNEAQNIHWQAGDTECLGEHQFDCAVIHMVLHHTPSPSRMFDEVARALKPGGILVVSELCQHNQDWVRQSCGDQWLGFAPTELDAWASDAQLTLGPSRYLAQRNGFQLQIRRFHKPATSS